MSRQPRAWALAGLALAVLGVHLALWREWTLPAAQADGVVLGWPSEPARAFEVRSLRVPTRDLPAPVQAPAMESTLPALLRPAPAAPASSRAAPVRSARLALASPSLAPTLPAAPPLLDPAQPAPPAESADAVLPAPPVYATRMPSPGRWRYRMQRGAVSGEAELTFQLAAVEAGEAAGYALQLTAHAVGTPEIDWASRGQLDAAGLAPERFALRRKGRDRQAANFQREAGKITFSGPTHAHPLPAGAQDRLSWLLQLTAIVAAAPDSFGAGTQVQIYVAGARGDAQVWVFAVEGRELLEGGVSMLKLVREPVRLYDTRAEVWLDPQRQFLPQRVLQTPQGGGPALDLTYEPGPI